MPNVGKPSKACKTCRDRKVKCDLKKPSCSQCLRAGKECHGYRDLLSVMFKNESTMVMSKAQKRYRELSKRRSELLQHLKESSASRKQPESSTSESSASSQSEDAEADAFAYAAMNVSRPASPGKPLIASIENQALGFFAANNLMQPSPALRGNYQWLLPMLSQPDVDPVVQSSAYAVSLATLGTANKSGAILKIAQQHYARALESTNQALGDPMRVRSDDTLVSVILLGVYENVLFSSYSLNAWMHHLKGASALLSLRGIEQFNSPLARQIFVQFFRTAVNAGIEISLPMPEGLTSLYEGLISLKDYTTHGVEHQVRVLVKAMEIMQDTNGNPITVVAEIYKLLHELDSMHFFLQTLWRYETVHTKQPAEHIMSSTYHIYVNSWVANMWNILRTCKVRLYKILRIQVNKGLRHSPPLFSSDEGASHLRTCEDVIRTQIMAICASTPQLTGQVAFPFQVKQNCGAGVSSVDLHHKKFAVHPQGTFLEPYKATGLNHLVGPMYEVGRSEYGPEFTKFAIHQLFFIARKIGTKQAIVLGEQLKIKLKAETLLTAWHDPCPSTAQLRAIAAARIDTPVPVFET